MFENRTIGAITVGFFFLFAGLDGAQQFIVPLFQQNAAGSTALNALIALYAVFFVSNFFGPSWVAYLGPRRALLIGSCTYPLLPLAVALENTWLLFFGASLTGLGATLLWNASGQIVSRYSTHQRFAFNQGLKYSALVIGGFVGSLFGGSLIASLNAQYIYWGYFFMGIAGVISFLFVGPTPRIAPVQQSLLTGLGRPEILRAAPFVTSGYFLMFLSMGAIKLDLLDRFGLTVVGIAGIIIRFGAALGALLAGWYSDRIQTPVFLAYIIAGLGVLGLVLFQFSTNRTVIFIACGFIAVSYASVYPVVTALLRKHCSRSQEDFDQSLGSFHVYGTGGMLLGLLLSDWLSPTWCITIALLGYIGSLLGISSMQRRSEF